MTLSIDAQIQFKHNIASVWEQNNPVILDGEIIFVDMPDGKRFMKIGNGVSTYNELPLRTLVEVSNNEINVIDAGHIIEQ